jgi:uncharacterized protein
VRPPAPFSALREKNLTVCWRKRRNASALAEAPLFEMNELMLSLPRRLLVTLVKGYRLLLSPWLGSSCRFEPTCSAYSLQALQVHGAAAGTYLTIHRLLRCHPFCQGGHDPVPDTAPRLFTMLLGGASKKALPVSPPSPEKTPS